MATNNGPEIGSWYRGPDGQMFEVNAIDEDAGTIDIQYYDGSVEELEAETWGELALQEVDAPEDWSGPFDDLEKDDLDEAESALHPEDYANPLDQLDQI